MPSAGKRAGKKKDEREKLAGDLQVAAGNTGNGGGIWLIIKSINYRI